MCNSTVNLIHIQSNVSGYHRSETRVQQLKINRVQIEVRSLIEASIASSPLLYTRG